MFDSNYNANSVLPIQHPTNNNNNIPFDDHHLLNNFPSHLLDEDFFLNTILPYHHPPPPPPSPPPPLPQPPLQQPGQAVNGCEERRKLPQKAKKQHDGGESSRRKAGKKDRHSKIYTAHGPRDRRMRLSLQIARKFFDLQDMLGFDKASKTIEWLFNKSRAAIKDLSEKSCTNIMSPIGDHFNGEGSNKKEKMVCGRMNNNNNNSKGGMMCEMNEKRKQARARARERTKEKLMKNKKECLEVEENPNNTSTLDDSNGVIRVDKVHQLEDQMASVGIIENFLASSSSSMSNFSHDGGLISRGFSMEFSGNRISDIGSGNVGLMQEMTEHSEFTNNQVQGLNCAFMDRTYNHMDFN